MDHGTTCISVEGTGGRPLGFQGPMGRNGQCDYFYICRWESWMSHGIPNAPWDRMDSGTTCIFVDDSGRCPMGSHFPWDRMDNGTTWVPWDKIDSETTCINIDGSGGCPMGFQGPWGQRDYLYKYRWEWRMSHGIPRSMGTGGLLVYLQIRVVNVPWDSNIQWDSGITCIAVNLSGECPRVPWSHGTGWTVGLLV